MKSLLVVAAGLLITFQASAQFTGQAGTDISFLGNPKPNGTFEGAVQVYIQARYYDSRGRHYDADRYYTLNGGSPLPSNGGTKYTGSLTLSPPQTVTIRAGHFSLISGAWIESSRAITLTVAPLKLTVNNTTGGYISPGSSSHPPGTSIRLTATPEPDWTFLKWSGDLSSTENPLDWTLNSDTTIGAVFASPLVLLTPTNGIVNASTNVSGLLLPGAEVLFTPTADPGYYFDSWGGVATGAAVPWKYIHTTANAQISATFLPLDANH